MYFMGGSSKKTHNQLLRRWPYTGLLAFAMILATSTQLLALIASGQQMQGHTQWADESGFGNSIQSEVGKHKARARAVFVSKQQIKSKSAFEHKRFNMAANINPLMAVTCQAFAATECPQNPGLSPTNCQGNVLVPTYCPNRENVPTYCPDGITLPTQCREGHFITNCPGLEGIATYCPLNDKTIATFCPNGEVTSTSCQNEQVPVVATLCLAVKTATYCPNQQQLISMCPDEEALSTLCPYGESVPTFCPDDVELSTLCPENILPTNCPDGEVWPTFCLEGEVASTECFEDVIPTYCPNGLLRTVCPDDPTYCN